MLTFPNIDPVVLHIWGPIAIRWYGLAYIFGAISAWYMGHQQIKKQKNSPITSQMFENMLTNAFLFLLIGGRVGYVLFYQFDNFLVNPINIFYVWEGGMSFHGAGIGLLLYGIYFSKKYKLPLLSITDFFAPLIPVGLGMGRLANFINAELIGRVTQVPWAMVFPNSDMQPRHPSQLYEMLVEGVLLFIIMRYFSKKNLSQGVLSAIFLTVYAVGRFFLEFFREPDPQLGFILWNWLTMGQVLTVLMLAMALLVWCISYKKMNPPVS